MADQNSTLLKIDPRELAWAAGLFEGEGCITHNGKYGKMVPKLMLCMSDEDAVARFHAAVGVGYFRERKAKASPRHRTQWEWRVLGHQKAQFVIALLWFGLGQRRRARAKEVLACPHRQGPTYIPRPELRPEWWLRSRQ